MSTRLLSSTLAMILRGLMVLPATVGSAEAAPKEPESQQGYGFVLQTDFSLSVLRIAASGDLTQSFGIEGGLFAGYKMDRLIQVSPTMRGLYRWTTTLSSDGAQSATRAVGLTTIDASIGFLGVF